MLVLDMRSEEVHSPPFAGKSSRALACLGERALYCIRRALHSLYLPPCRINQPLSSSTDAHRTRSANSRNGAGNVSTSCPPRSPSPLTAAGFLSCKCNANRATWSMSTLWTCTQTRPFTLSTTIATHTAISVMNGLLAHFRPKST
jgi:hypothetical protein